MLPSPSSSPRPPLLNLTNTRITPPLLSIKTRFSGLPTPPEHGTGKRQFSDLVHVQKRVKLDFGVGVNASEDCGEEQNDDESDLDSVEQPVRYASKTCTTFSKISAAKLGLSRPGNNTSLRLTTRPILQSFVSSKKTDVYKCDSKESSAYMTSPYACAYSNDAKNGGTPLLAIATEEGSVHIINTTKRSPWDAEPTRTILYPHSNGIFDIKWSPSSTLIATSSGDTSTRISCPTTQRTLHTLDGHSSTAKCVVWNPAHRDLLSTGGRDGSILVWDLRVSGGQRGEPGICQPVLTVPAAHGQGKKTGRKSIPPARSVTGLLYPESGPHAIISSGAFDGILHCWDLRSPTRKSRSTKPKTPTALYTSTTDPTAVHGSRRPRGIISLSAGTGPTASLLFALGADSRIHMYDTPTLEPLTTKLYTHENMQTNSFYVRLAMSPCGRWLATGGAMGNIFLFDVSDTCRAGVGSRKNGVELRGQMGEVGALDWSAEALASAADDQTVRTWRPDIVTYKECLRDEDKGQWDWSWSLPDQSDRT